jgi:hypothetical protein
MKLALLFLLLPACAWAENGFPYTQESLDYTINWPSGLSLGEGHLVAKKAPDRWEFTLDLNADIPALTVKDHYHSVANGKLCSVELQKETVHGPRTTRETETFDASRGVARRVTLNGGKSEVPINACARDALTFLYYARQELAQGRVPPPQTVFFGGEYTVRMEYTGAQTVAVNERREQADRVSVSFKGKASDLVFEIFFARDAARTPLVFRVPFSLGTFSMELVRQ